MKVIYRPQPRSEALIGLVSDGPYWLEHGVEGWIDDADNEELSSMLFGGGQDIRFVPTILEDLDVAVPCKQASISGALIRNLATEDDDRVMTVLIKGAKAIADAGNRHHETILESNRSLIDGI